MTSTASSSPSTPTSAEASEYTPPDEDSSNNSPAPIDGNSESHYSEFSDMRNAKKRRGGDVAAVFVHAGAGFHSVSNEASHLGACSDATKAGMLFVSNGGSAVDAVEAAVRVLEDNEITNCGYGSNLAVDGTVECDATIVDHYGRSGAVGAMGNVLHPIHVARMVLEGSCKTLSLRRVPPNLLVGQGAIDFAFDQGIPIFPDDHIIAPGARERWLRWQRDVERANRKDNAIIQHNASGVTEAGAQTTNALGLQNETLNADAYHLAPLANESQPFSPSLSPSADSKPPRGTLASPLGMHIRFESSNDDPGKARQDHISLGESLSLSSHHESGDDRSDYSILRDQHDKAEERQEEIVTSGTNNSKSRTDFITDTVGAIAIDQFGNIAAASSSGGIGMKHKGRTGPAALVGIGTAVHPIHPSDKEKKCVAVVTSGTGEHMATTLAAGMCAQRLYWGTKLSPNGGVMLTDDEDAIQSFVKKDFMGHPSVKHSNTSAAIGTMAVKKSIDGLWFYFAHNTDSFAVCSMTSEDAEPVAVMSRSNHPGLGLTTGARSCTWRPPREELKESRKRRKAVQKD